MYKKKDRRVESTPSPNQSEHLPAGLKTVYALSKPDIKSLAKIA